MGTGIRRPWSQAEAEAREFRDSFPRHLYERWVIGGSIRRNKPDIGDVEHIVLPKQAMIQDPTAFPGILSDQHLLFAWLDQQKPEKYPKHNYNYTGEGPPAHKWGQKYRGVDYKQFGHEIFCADARNWGYILFLRTGPDKFNMRVVDHINKQTRLQLRDGYLRYRGSSDILDCPDEETFFQHIGMAYVQPERRFA